MTIFPGKVASSVSDSGLHSSEPEENSGNLLALALLSVLVGVASGVTGASFRLALMAAADWRNRLLELAHGWSVGGLLIVIAVCAGATGLAAWLVRRFAPLASGSGIPHVECVLSGLLPPVPFWLFPVKFVGGVLAIGAGLALGREGPSVQMGASIAHLIGKFFRRNWPDCRVLIAAGAGSGLATAFNAPIAGSVFVLEELLRRFDVRTTIATFGASAGAIWISRLMLGAEPDFNVDISQYSGFGAMPIYLVLGLVAGLLGVIYNRSQLFAMRTVDRFRRYPAEVYAAIVGGLVGLLAWFAPEYVGGGDKLTQSALTGTTTVGALSLVFLLRFVLSTISYSARTPGGLFAPMMVLGTQSGLIFGMLCAHWFPGIIPQPVTFALVGMAAFFAGVVRAPVTGIILVTEMTGNFTLLLPMLAACFTAMALPTLLGNEPIYDSLRLLTLRNASVPESPKDSKRTAKNAE
jgi:CIC family chloride channel protein